MEGREVGAPVALDPLATQVGVPIGAKEYASRRGAQKDDDRRLPKI
jgi:hypothetical protein